MKKIDTQLFACTIAPNNREMKENLHPVDTETETIQGVHGNLEPHFD